MTGFWSHVSRRENINGVESRCPGDERATLIIPSQRQHSSIPCLYMFRNMWSIRPWLPQWGGGSNYVLLLLQTTASRWMGVLMIWCEWNIRYVKNSLGLAETKSFMPDWMISTSAVSPSILVLSANLMQKSCSLLGRLAIITRNKSGPMTNPCETAPKATVSLNMALPIHTWNARAKRKLLTWVTRWSKTPRNVS